MTKHETKMFAYVRCHSQRMFATPASPWIIAKRDGTILAAHCDCMEGLGESCSHVAAMLFHIEYANRLLENKTVTQEKAYWMPPNVREAGYKEIKEIDFTSHRSLKRKADEVYSHHRNQLNVVLQQHRKIHLPLTKKWMGLLPN